MNLFEGSYLTFHLCFKIKWGCHNKMPSILLSVVPKGLEIETKYRKSWAMDLFDGLDDL